MPCPTLWLQGANPAKSLMPLPSPCAASIWPCPAQFLQDLLGDRCPSAKADLAISSSTWQNAWPKFASRCCISMCNLSHLLISQYGNALLMLLTFEKPTLHDGPGWYMKDELQTKLCFGLWSCHSGCRLQWHACSLFDGTHCIHALRCQ